MQILSILKKCGVIVIQKGGEFFYIAFDKDKNIIVCTNEHILFIICKEIVCFNNSFKE